MTCEIFTYYKVSPEKESEYIDTAHQLRALFMEFPECISYRIYRCLDDKQKNIWMEWGQFTSHEDFENIFQQILTSDIFKKTVVFIAGGIESRKTEIFTEA
ncbi:antibiotic biosynthesis monooxygenase [bacterium]|nr:antibiotic biosynthesis monooxygenase [bacterium]